MTFPTLNHSRASYFGFVHSLFFCIVLCSFSGAHAETLAPPTLGEETKGEPAIDETKVVDSAINDTEKPNAPESKSPLGTATVTEHKRESGQVYLIELEHSFGAKQYLYENDSDGQIGSSIEDNDSIKEIPKWKLGSW